MTWPTYTLEEVAAPTPNALATGPFGSAVASHNFRPSGVPMLRGSNLSTDVGVRLLEDDVVYLDPTLAASFTRSIARRGDLVFTSWGTVGQLGLIGRNALNAEYIVSNKQMKLTPDPQKCDSTFLYYCLSSGRSVRAITEQSIGSTIPGFNLGQLRKLKVELPPLPEQQAIAEVLGALDDKIAANRALVSISAALRAASVQEVSDPSQPQILLSELAVVLTRGQAPKYTQVDGAAIVINQKCVRDGRVQLNDARRTSLPPSPERTLQFGDVLVNSTGMGTLGRVAIWTHPEHATVDSHVSIVRLPREDFPLCRAQQLIQAEHFITSLGEGSTGQTELSRGILGSVTVPELHRDRATACEDLIRRALELEQSKVEESAQLVNLRDTLLPALMDGTIRVKDAITMAEEVL